MVESSNTLLRDNEVRMVSTFLKRKLCVFQLQFISLSIDLLQGVNHKDIENSHRIR